jgi:hypothetical protein
MRWVLLIGMMLACAGCYSAVTLRHPVTGEIVQCGP